MRSNPNRRHTRTAYRSVENAVPRQAPILMQPMVRLAESDTRTTASDGTCIDRVKAAEEGGRP